LSWGWAFPLWAVNTRWSSIGQSIGSIFYHLQLRCFVVIDLKMGAFQPEFSGKMNFYVAVVDDLLRHATDNPTIGLILYKSKSRTTAEYALRNIQTPIGVSTHKLPQPLQENLPSIEQLEMELQTIKLSQEDPDLVESR
jgi:YhcG PDDEXK nuclease domain